MFKALFFNVAAIRVDNQRDSLALIANMTFLNNRAITTAIIPIRTRYVSEKLFKILNNQAIIEGSTTIKVTGFDTLGCYDTESVLIRIYPRAIVRAGNDFVINFRELRCRADLNYVIHPP